MGFCYGLDQRASLYRGGSFGRALWRFPRLRRAIMGVLSRSSKIPRLSSSANFLRRLYQQSRYIKCYGNHRRASTVVSKPSSIPVHQILPRMPNSRSTNKPSKIREKLSRILSRSSRTTATTTTLLLLWEMVRYGGFAVEEAQGDIASPSTALMKATHLYSVARSTRSFHDRPKVVHMHTTSTRNNHTDQRSRN